MTDTPINIIGPGAIGVLTAYYLRESKFSFSILDRGGKSVGRSLLVQGNAYQLESDAKADLSAAPISFVCVRAPDLDKALDQFLSKLNANSIVVVIGNGWIEPILNEYQRRFPNLTIRWGSTTFGVSKLGSNSFELRSEQGSYFWGALNTQKPAFQCSQIERYIIEQAKTFEFRADSEILLQEKWLMNTVINTLCGAYKLRSNGNLRSKASEVDVTFEEAYGLGEKAIPNWQINPVEAKANVLQLIEKTATNENSMARDIRLGRNTEADFFSGLALGYDGFPQLKKLHNLILNLSSDQ